MAFSIQCKGRVQGVFYRASTLEKANALGLSGWVKNEPDGSVLIHAEGSEERLQELIKWCEIGPKMAVVTQVDFHEVADEMFNEFQIRY